MPNNDTFARHAIASLQAHLSTLPQGPVRDEAKLATLLLEAWEDMRRAGDARRGPPPVFQRPRDPIWEPPYLRLTFEPPRDHCQSKPALERIWSLNIDTLEDQWQETDFLPRKISIPFRDPDLLKPMKRRRRTNYNHIALTTPAWEAELKRRFELLLDHYGLPDATGPDFWPMLASKLIDDFVPGLNEGGPAKGGRPVETHSPAKRADRARLLAEINAAKPKSAMERHVVLVRAAKAKTNPLPGRFVKMPSSSLRREIALAESESKMRLMAGDLQDRGRFSDYMLEHWQDRKPNRRPRKKVRRRRQ